MSGGSGKALEPPTAVTAARLIDVLRAFRHTGALDRGLFVAQVARLESRFKESFPEIDAFQQQSSAAKHLYFEELRARQGLGMGALAAFNLASQCIAALIALDDEGNTALSCELRKAIEAIGPN